MITPSEFKAFFRLADEYDAKPISELIDLVSDRIVVEKVFDDGRILIRNRRRKAGFIYVSDLESYLYCARKTWLTLHHGQIVDEKGLKAIIRGILAHREWAKYAKGGTEVEVVDYELGIIGHIDELRFIDGELVVIELKTSWRIADYHLLKLRSYMFLVDRMYKVKPVGVLVYRRGLKVIGKLSEKDIDYVLRYLKRARKVLLSNVPPPRLPRQFRSRCNYCPLRPECRSYPDETSWSEWLLEFMPEKCQTCKYNSFCLEFKHVYGRPPCETTPSVIKNWLRVVAGGA